MEIKYGLIDHHPDDADRSNAQKRNHYVYEDFLALGQALQAATE
jgi:hypothetical protein